MFSLFNPFSMGPTPKVKATIGSEVKSCLKWCLSHNVKTTEASFVKFNRNIKHNKKVCIMQKSKSLPGVKDENAFYITLLFRLH